MATQPLTAESAPRLLDMAVRAFIEPIDQAAGGSGERPGERIPSAIMVLDTETTIDAAQRLRFGVFRYYRCRVEHGLVLLSCREEGVFYDDDLPTRDAGGVTQSDGGIAYEQGKREPAPNEWPPQILDWSLICLGWVLTTIIVTAFTGSAIRRVD
jgi:hypothetical protein